MPRVRGSRDGHNPRLPGTLTLLTAFQRLIELLDEPKDIPILAPIIQREIFYRLLVDDRRIYFSVSELISSRLS